MLPYDGCRCHNTKFTTTQQDRKDFINTIQRGAHKFARGSEFTCDHDKIWQVRQRTSLPSHKLVLWPWPWQYSLHQPVCYKPLLLFLWYSQSLAQTWLCKLQFTVFNYKPLAFNGYAKAILLMELHSSTVTETSEQATKHPFLQWIHSLLPRTCDNW